MSEYVPTTDMVKTRYSIGRGNLSDAAEDARAKAFDAWLADAIATALEEAADDLEAPSPANLFKWAGPARSWLRTRAARIREEGKA